MRLSFWSDEDRWFVPRAFGLGYSLNLKYVAKRLGLIRPASEQIPEIVHSQSDQSADVPKTREQRLRERIESSRYEDL